MWALYSEYEMHCKMHLARAGATEAALLDVASVLGRLASR
jgi:hypothetical protein